MAQSAAYKSDSTRRATYQDVLDAPAHRVAEIIDGTLYTHPRPAMPHARASSSLGVKIGGPFDYDAGGPGGWWIFSTERFRTWLFAALAGVGAKLMVFG